MQIGVMEFEWNPDKADLNLRNHGIAFEVATRVFFDVYRVEEDDPYPSEDRQRVIGLVDGRMLFVVVAIRDDMVRIISARPADPKEKRRYHEG